MFNLNLEVLEREEYLGSVKSFLYFEISHPTGKFIYEASDIWFEEQLIIDFVSRIEVGFSDWEIGISDLSNYVNITISRRMDTNHLIATIYEPLNTIGSDIKEIQLKAQLDIDNDILFAIKGTFKKMLE